VEAIVIFQRRIEQIGGIRKVVFVLKKKKKNDPSTPPSQCST
jgi:hypothetical protein